MLNSALDESFRSGPLTAAIARALAALPVSPASLGVALSGGADSAMMAVHARLLGRDQGLPVHFFHVHHGLQSQADQWQAHVHDLAQGLEAPCHSIRIQVDMSGGEGVESAARHARYTALHDLAVRVGVRHILLAHHRDDQAETVLLRLLRGAGPTGLAAMSPIMRRQGQTYLRPWLDMDRGAILASADAFFRLTGWRPVQDPTNADDAYTRSALRARLTPDLDQRWPGWQGSLVRHARLSAQVSQVLDEVMAQDFAALDPSADALSFSLQAWRGLSHARQALVLRYWLSRFCPQLPSDARLQDIMRQLRGLHALGHDRHMRVRHGDVWVRCIRGRVLLDVSQAPSDSMDSS